MPELTNALIKQVLVLTKADVNLANVDNTTDLAKPISTATAAALSALDVRVSTLEGVSVLAPAITSVGAFEVAENQAFSSTATANKTVTWSVSGTNASEVTINATTGAWSIPPQNYEVRPVFSFVLTATDTSGNTANKAITVTITDVAEGGGGAPTITSSSSVSVAENAPFAFLLTADQTGTWEIIGGADLIPFDIGIDPTDCLAFDYEAPVDVGLNNTYEITVRFTSTSTQLTAEQTITVTVTDSGEDGVPNAFTFTDVTGATASTVYQSNLITIAGIDTTASVSIVGGEFSKNGGAYTSSGTTVVSGDTLRVRVTSSSAGLTAVNTTLTVGGVSDTYSVTTAQAALAGPTPVVLNFSVGAGAVTTGITDSAGGTTGRRFVMNGSLAEHYLYPNRPTSAGLCRLEAEFKPYGTANFVWIGLGGGKRSWFNVSTGALGTKHADHTVTIAATSGGFYKCTIEGVGTLGGIIVGTSFADNTFYITGDGASGYDWCNANIFA